MPGFFGLISPNSSSFSLAKKENLINDEIRNENIYLHRHTIKKFLDDKLFEETNDYIFILEALNQIKILSLRFYL